MKTVLMAGGKGTRISSVNDKVPKPLIPIGGIPVLERELAELSGQGFDDVIITVSHMADQIIEYFGDGSRLGIHIDYYVEQVPLGNAGALFRLALEDDFLLLNADTMFNVDFNRFTRFHKEHASAATLFTHPNSHPYDSVLVDTDDDDRVTGWITKEDARPEYYRNLVNAGLHVLSPEALKMSGVDPDMIGRQIDGKVFKVDLDRDILRPLCATGRVFSYQSPEYVRDMGTPERYEAVCRDVASGMVHERNLSLPQKAVFLDRDGTINRYVGFLRDLAQMELLPGAADALRMLNDSVFLSVVVTNQPVISRGEVTYAQLRTIHNAMETLLGTQGAFIDRLYFCPHHPDSGFEGEIRELKIDCSCRKPKPGMLIKASQELNIDLSQSWMVGDSENDILAGKAAGCRTALIGDGDFGQDMTVSSLLEFTSKLISRP